MLHDAKCDLVLATEDDWNFMNHCLDKDQARTLASIDRTQYLAEYQQFGTFPTPSVPSISARPSEGQPSAPKPPLHALSMAVSALATDAHNAAPTLDEWFDLSPLRSLSIDGKVDLAIVPRAILRAGMTGLRELRLEGWSVNTCPAEALVVVLRAVGHSLRTLHLTPLKTAAFPVEVLTEVPQLRTLSLHAVSGENFTEFLAVGSDSLRTISPGTRRSIPSPDPGPPSALPSRLIASLLASAPVLPSLKMVGFYALDFAGQYVRSAGETVELNFAAAEAGWTVVDRHGDDWQAARASDAGDEWGSAGEGAAE